MAKNLSLDRNKKNERVHKTTSSNIKTNLSPKTPTATTSSSFNMTKLTSARLPSSRNENQESLKSKLSASTASSLDSTQKLSKTKDKLSRTLSNEEQKAKLSTNNNIISKNNTNSTNALIGKKENGELRNRAKSSSFTPIHLTSGMQLAAVLAEHKKLEAVGYKPDHDMIQKTIEIGTSKIGQLNNNQSSPINTINSLTNNSTKLNNNKINQAKYKSLSLNDDDNSQKFDENNNELVTADKQRKIYLSNPKYLGQKALDSSTKYSANDQNKNLPDSMNDLLNRSAKAREPLSKTVNKQFINKRKAPIKDSSLDSGTSSPTRSSTSLMKTNKPPTTLSKGRSDFARNYALTSKPSPLNDRSNKQTNLVRSNTFSDLNEEINSIGKNNSLNTGNFININNTSSLGNSNINPSPYSTSSNASAIIHRNPRSDYAKTSKYTTLLKSKSTHSLNKID